MAGYFPLPAYRDPGPVDFSPVNNAIDSNRLLSLKRQQLDQGQQKIDLAKNADARAATTHQNQIVDRNAAIMGNIMTAVLAEKDPQRKAAMMNDAIAAGGGIEALPPGMQKAVQSGNIDPVARMLQARIGKMMTPEQQQMVMAELRAKQAEGAQGFARADLFRAQAEAAKNKGTAGPDFGKAGSVFVGPDGRAYTVQFASNGERRILPVETNGVGLVPDKGVMTVDTETGTRIIDRSRGSDVRQIDKDIVGKQTQARIGKEQGDFRARLPKIKNSLDGFERDTAAVNAAIDRAIANLRQNGRFAGGLGSLLSAIPETQANALKRDLETIAANQGFDKLDAMRQASPTGGALGQVSEFENRLLQSVQGNLSQDQRPDALIAVLEEIKRLRTATLADRKRAYEADAQRFGGQGGSGQWGIRKID